MKNNKVTIIIHWPGIGDDVYNFPDWPTRDEIKKEIVPTCSSLYYNPAAETMRSEWDEGDYTYYDLDLSGRLIFRHASRFISIPYTFISKYGKYEEARRDS